MTYLINSSEDWGNKVAGTEADNKYTLESLVSATCIEDAITLWNQDLKDRQNNNKRPQLTATIYSIRQISYHLIH